MTYLEPCGVRKFDRAANRSVSRTAEFAHPHRHTRLIRRRLQIARRMQLFDDPAVKRLSQLCSMSVEYELETVAVRLRGEFDLTCEEKFREELESAFEARPTR